MNFGEELIKEMIMCRSAAIIIIYYFQSMLHSYVQSASLKHNMKSYGFSTMNGGGGEGGGDK